MISLFSNPKSKRSIILNVQSDLVRGALIESNKNGIAKCLSSFTKSIPNTIDTSDSGRMIKKVCKLAHDVTNDLINESGHDNISSVHYILSSPWVFSELRNIKVNYNSSEKITTDTITKLINNEARTITTGFDGCIFEKKIFEIKLNGYVINQYEGKLAKTLEVSFSLSFTTKDFMTELKYSVGTAIHIKSHSFHSALLTQYIALGNLLASKKEYIYVHIHGELTDIIIVKDDLCRHIASFPMGINTIHRELAKLSYHAIEATDSLFTLFYANKLNEPEKQKIGKIIEPLLESWSKMCVKSFLSSFDITHMPKTVFISAHSHREIFGYMLQSQKDLNFDVISYTEISDSDRGELMNMYTYAVSDMI